METLKQEDLIEKPLPSEGEEGTEKEPEQDPLKTELEKVQKKEGGRTKREKLIFTKKRLDKQLAELDEEEGIEEPEDDDDAPVTVRMLKDMQKKTTVKTALDLADEIDAETERELVKYHIQNTIKSTGNPKEDLKLARAIVNNSKNEKVIEELQRKPGTKNHSGGSGGPAKPAEQEPEYTAEEQAFMRPPFNMSKDQILKARGG